MFDPTTLTALTAARDVPDLLIRLRLRTGLTQQDVAARLDLKQSQISQYEKGARPPSVGVFLDLLDLYEAALLVADHSTPPEDPEPEPRVVDESRTVVVRDLTEVGHALRRSRLRAGLTQAQAADQAGVDQSNLSKWESGMPPPLAALWRLSTTYGVVLVLDFPTGMKGH